MAVTFILSGLSKLRSSIYTSILVNIELSYIKRIRMRQWGASDPGRAEAFERSAHPPLL